MRQEAVFLNGVFETVFKEILETQAELPEQILFLQPFGGAPIVDLQNDPPTVNDPVQLYMSTTDALGVVSYAAEAVGWEDKRQLAGKRRRIIETLLRTFQPMEKGLKDSDLPSGPSINLIHVRRMRHLAEPFPVRRLIKISSGTPLQPRKSAGRWSYVSRLS